MGGSQDCHNSSCNKEKDSVNGIVVNTRGQPTCETPKVFKRKHLFLSIFRTTFNINEAIHNELNVLKMYKQSY